MKNIKSKIFNTPGNWPATITRFTLGGVLLQHGMQKLFGLFGGMGFSNTMQYFTQVVHIPWLIGFIVIMIESVGSTLLILGFATRIITSFIIPLFIGIIITHHWQAGFFMDWFGANPKGFEGIEFDLLMMGLALSLIISGGGKWSVDRRLTNN
jgi:putative oxidoreductase